MVNEQYRCIRHQSVLPLSIPLVSGALPPTFTGDPHIFTKQLENEETHELTTLSRLRSTKKYNQLITQMGKKLLLNTKSTHGVGELERWGLEVGDADVVIEDMNDMLQGSLETGSVGSFSDD